MLMAITVNAQLTLPTVNVRSDKPQYVPGEVGTLHITFRNDQDTPISIHNITLLYRQWQAYINKKWVGNQTLNLERTVKEKGTEHLTSVDFSVPDDGRASEDCVITVQVNTNRGPYSGSTTVHVVETPHHMQQIINLLTVLVILLIVCTIIIAATIYLSIPKQKTPKREPETKQQ